MAARTSSRAGRSAARNAWRGRAARASAAAGAGVEAGGGGAAESFAGVVGARYTCKAYDPARPLPAGALEACLAAARRAPTGFNVQPYVAVAVRGEEAKRALAKCMLGPNAQRVLDAPATVVFAADNRSAALVPKLMRLMRRDGAPEGYIRLIPLYVNLFAGGFAFCAWLRPLRVLLNLVVYLGRKVALALASYVMPVPTPSTAETWSHKNTIFPAAFFVLAATARGLATTVMEGYDSRRVANAVGLPGRYTVPVVVSLGYAKDAGARRETSRYAPEELFFEDRYGAPLPGVPAA